MKREIQYDTTDRSKAETKALKDVKQWFGTKKYNQFVKAFTVCKGRVNRIELEIAMAINGVEGFPADVFIDKYWSPQMQLDL
jgi:hypothetical protein